MSLFDDYLRASHNVGRQFRSDEDPAVVFQACLRHLLPALGAMSPFDRSRAALGLRMAADAVDRLENRSGEEAHAAMLHVLAAMEEIGLPEIPAGQFRGEQPQQRVFRKAS